MNISFAVGNHIDTFDQDKGELTSSTMFLKEALKAYLRAGYMKDVRMKVCNQEVTLETFFSDDDDIDHYLARITIDQPFLSFTSHYLVGVDEDCAVVDIVELCEEDFSHEVGMLDVDDSDEKDSMYDYEVSQAKVLTS